MRQTEPSVGMWVNWENTREKNTKGSFKRRWKDEASIKQCQIYAWFLSVLTSSTLFIHGRSDVKPWQLSYRTIDIMARKRCQWSTFYVQVKLSFGWQRAHCKTYIMPTGMINRIFPKEYFVQLCMSVNNLLHNLLYQFLIYNWCIRSSVSLVQMYLSRWYLAKCIASHLQPPSPYQDWGLKLQLP